MPVSLEIINLVLYCVQQLGIMLGVGAQTILLIADLLASHDGVIDKQEEQFLRAVKRVIYFALFCIISSGILITLLHLGAGQGAIVLQPAFLFKWVLIGAVFIFALLEIRASTSMTFLKAFTGGTWYALFIVHILAPITTWGMLGFSYLIWIIGFVICWSAIVFAVGKKSPSMPVQQTPPRAVPIPIASRPAPIVVAKPVPVVEAKVPAPPTAPISAAPPPPAPTFSLPESSEQFPYSATGSAPMLHPHLTSENAPNIPAAPPPPSAGGAFVDADATEHLPAIRVMPQNPKDLETQHRGPLVRFG